MRTLLMTLLVAFSLPSAHAQIPEEAVEPALLEAFYVIRKATELTSSSELRAIGQQMLAKEPHVRAHLAPQGMDWAPCTDEATGAFVRKKDRKDVFVCKRDLVWMNFRQLVQILVHEIVHLTGIHDECEASRIELKIIKTMFREEAYESKYAEECGNRLKW